MLTAFRAFAKSWVAALLIGLLIVAFAVFGISDVFRNKMSTSVIEAGSRKVTPLEFRRQFDSQRQRLEQQTGRAITSEVAAENGLDRQLLQAMATQEAFVELLNRLGVRPSDAAVAKQIGAIPAFLNQVTGRFDQKTYKQKLLENDLTTARFEASVRDEMATQHFMSALAGSLTAPRAYGALAALYVLESRDVAYLTITPSGVPRPADPTDAQLTAFMKENAAKLTMPETRQLTVVRFSPSQVEAAVTVDEAEVRKRFDFRKDTLATPETRTVVQIPAKDAAAAQAITARLQRGEAPAAVAKSVGVDAITYVDKPQSAFADHKVGAAAFKASAGQLSTVQGDIGLAVVRVEAVTPGKAASFEEARPAIEAEIRKDAIADKVYALTQVYDDAHQKGANLMEAAKKAGVEPVVVPPVTKEGSAPGGPPIPGLNPKLLETAFGLPAGGESQVVEAGAGEYFAVRVDKIVPPAMPPLAQIKPDLARVWIMQELAKAMQAKADALAARVTKGESLDQVATSAGATVDRATGVDRQSAQSNPLMTPEIIARAFASKPGEVFTARGPRGIVVGKLEAVQTGAGPQLAALTEQARMQMAEAIFRDMRAGAEDAARQKLKVRVDYARARSAIGLEPAATAPKGKPEPSK